MDHACIKSRRSGLDFFENKIIFFSLELISFSFHYIKVLVGDGVYFNFRI